MLPGSAGNATRAFNNSTLAFVNKFDTVATTSNTGELIPATGTDLVFSGDGRWKRMPCGTRDLLARPTAAIVTFQLAGTDNASSQPDAASLLVGDNLGDDASIPADAARLR